MSCELPEEQLWSWIDREAPELDAHLASCPHCRQLAREIRAGIRGGAIGLQALAPPLPDRIGSYKITSLLGEGGQGVVYAAEQQTPRRPVALKVLKAGRFVGAHDLRHFQREIQSMAALQHPGIATIYEAGRTEDGQHFLAMELVDGLPLNEYVCKCGRGGDADCGGNTDSGRDCALALKDRLLLFCKICDALHYAHEHGVIHRDLKPSNILVTADGQPKILDFGLARLTGADVTLTRTATQAGQILGTLRYMSPDQARGDPEKIDERSDVYSLGVVLYELLTDQPPYELSDFIPDAVLTICETPPHRPSAVTWWDGRPARHLRGDPETIVLKALEKKAGRRYASAQALVDDVRRYLAAEPIRARPPSGLYVLRKKLAKHRLGVVVVLAAGLLALATACGAIWWQYRSQQQRAQELRRVRWALAAAQNNLELGYPGGPISGQVGTWRDQYPELREADLVVAQACFRDLDTGGREGAVNTLASALRRDPSRWECAALLAQIHRETGEPALAAEFESRQRAPNTGEAWYLQSFATLDAKAA